MRQTATLSLLALGFVAAGCGSPRPDDLVKQSIKQWEQAAAVLESIRDEADVKDAGAQLDAIAQQMVDLNKKAATLELSGDERWQLEADNRKESQAALSRFNQAANRVKNIPGGAEVLVRFRRMSARAF